MRRVVFSLLVMAIFLISFSTLANAQSAENTHWALKSVSCNDFSVSDFKGLQKVDICWNITNKNVSTDYTQQLKFNNLNDNKVDMLAFYEWSNLSKSVWNDNYSWINVSLNFSEWNGTNITFFNETSNSTENITVTGCGDINYTTMNYSNVDYDNCTTLNETTCYCDQYLNLEYSTIEYYTDWKQLFSFFKASENVFNISSSYISGDERKTFKATIERKNTNLVGIKDWKFSIYVTDGTNQTNHSIYIDPWLFGNWSARAPITITELSGKNLTDYQVKLEIPWDLDMQDDVDDLRFTYNYTLYETPVTITSSANLTDYSVLIDITDPNILKTITSDGRDLRFFSSQTDSPYSQIEDKIPYWFEEKSDSHALVWVKVNLTVGSNIIYMYSGHPNPVSESNGSAVFLVFDDFEDRDLTGWTTEWGSWSASGGYLKNILKGVIHYDQPFDEIELQFMGRTTPPITRSRALYVFMLYDGKYSSVYGWASDFYMMHANAYSPYENIAFWRSVSGSWTIIMYNDTYPDTNWHLFKVQRNQTGGIKYWVDDALNYFNQTTDTQITDGDYIGFHVNVHGSAEYDDIRVRKFTDPEPTLSTGTPTVKEAEAEVEIPYWIEKYYASTNATVWIKVPYISANDNATVYMYYGNPKVGNESDYNALLANADPFFNTKDGWTEIGDEIWINTTSKQLEYDIVCNTNNDKVYTTFDSYSGDFVLRYKIKLTHLGNPPNDIGIFFIGTSDSPSSYIRSAENAIFFEWGWNRDKTFSRIMEEYGGTEYLHGYTENTISTNIVYYVKMIRNGTDAIVHVYYDEAETNETDFSPITATLHGTPAQTGVGFYAYQRTAEWGDVEGYVDNFIMTKYTYPEPTYSIGAEETQVPPNVAPEVFLVSPADGNISGPEMPNFTFYFTDDQEYNNCTLYIGYFDYGTVEAQNNTVTGITPTQNLDGNFDWYVICTDPYDAMNMSETRSITLDTVGPTIHVVSPVSNKTYLVHDIDVNISADEPVSMWMYRLDQGGNVTFTKNITIAVGEGVHYLEICAKSGVGVWHCVVKEFIVDTLAPEVSVTYEEVTTETVTMTVKTNEPANLTITILETGDNKKYVMVEKGTAKFTGLHPSTTYNANFHACDKNKHCDDTNNHFRTSSSSKNSRISVTGGTTAPALTWTPELPAITCTDWKQKCSIENSLAYLTYSRICDDYEDIQKEPVECCIDENCPEAKVCEDNFCIESDLAEINKTCEDKTLKLFITYLDRVTVKTRPVDCCVDEDCDEGIECENYICQTGIKPTCGLLQYEKFGRCRWVWEDLTASITGFFGSITGFFLGLMGG